jgi:hypothetical protein
MTDDENSNDFNAQANEDGGSPAPKTPSPLEAIRAHCLWCGNGSAGEVRLCTSKSCSHWAYRFGRKPTAAMIAEAGIPNEAGIHEMYPVEDGMKVADFYATGTPLKAIRRRCLDFSGGCKSEVRDCWDVACALHPFRLGENPNRKMSEERRALAAACLKANIERGKRNRG